MLAWIDLEATSLATTAHVLEVAAIVTDDQLREIDRFHRVVYWDGADGLSGLDADSSDEVVAAEAELARIDLVVARLHARNGLWAASYASRYLLRTVDSQLAEFLARTSVDAAGQKAQIAGSSIWFDRGLMAVSLPLALKQLHYRCVDVTTLNELARRFCPAVHSGVPKKREVHRSMPDIEDSLALCRYYVEQVARGTRDATVTLRAIMGDHLEEMVRKTGADYLQFAKKKVTERKALVAIFACALREALDDLSPDERAAWLKIAVAEVQR